MSVLYTPSVARDVAKIIRDYHAAVAAVLYGQEAVHPDDWQRALDLGLVDPAASRAEQIEQLHQYGAYLAHLEQSEVQDRYGVGLDEFLAEVRRNPVPQTEVEAHAARSSALRAAQNVVGLGNRVGADVDAALVEADRALDQYLRGVIRDVVSARHGDNAAAKRVEALGVAEGLPDDFFDDQFRATVQRVTSDLGHATGDWARDLQRIAQTECHSTVQLGMVESWLQQEDDAARDAGRAPKRVRVFKLPRPGACRECVRLHLDGDVPRIFYLDTLISHGTNVGLKRRDWNAVVGSTHPWCGCSLHRVSGILTMPRGWRSGEAAPTVIGPGGAIVVED